MFGYEVASRLYSLETLNINSKLCNLTSSYLIIWLKPAETLLLWIIDN